jgi:hypothetical protein
MQSKHANFFLMVKLAAPVNAPLCAQGGATSLSGSESCCVCMSLVQELCMPL